VDFGRIETWLLCWSCLTGDDDTDVFDCCDVADVVDLEVKDDLSVVGEDVLDLDVVGTGAGRQGALPVPWFSLYS